MPDYELRLLNEAGAARSVAPFAAPNDALAARASEDAAAGEAAELWRGELLIATFARPLEARRMPTW